jgi:hypothetical protein
MGEVMAAMMACFGGCQRFRPHCCGVSGERTVTVALFNLTAEIQIFSMHIYCAGTVITGSDRRRNRSNNPPVPR